MKTVLIALTLLLLVGFSVLPVLAQNVTDGIVAYWAFNETSGETATDSSDNGHDGMLIGDPKWTKDGYFGGALEFDGTEDEVNIPYHEDLNQETFTICAWANVEPGSADHRAVVSSRDDLPADAQRIRGYIFYAEPQNTWQFWTGAGPTPWKVVQGPDVNLGEWDHLAGTYADGTMKFYVNGEFVGETASDIVLNSSQEFLIGAGQNEGANHNFLFKGKIDEVRLYDRALDENEIAAVMESDSLAVEPSGKFATTWGQLKAK